MPLANKETSQFVQTRSVSGCAALTGAAAALAGAAAAFALPAFADFLPLGGISQT